MARQHHVGECIVWMNRGHYNVSLIESVNSEGYGYSTSTSFKVFMTYDRYEAHRIQFMINGWGLAEFTISKTQRDFINAALDVLRRHSFNRSNCYEWEVKFAEMYAKANADCFKAIVAKIENTESRQALTQMWIAKFQVSKGEMTQENYDTLAADLCKVAYAA
ncbi:MAG: hypothetical protein NC411_02800 [Bacteroides sp.]|nr:hypothetical protein [Bacteroides sp.]